MPTSSEVYDLIQSLGKAEKKAFRRMVQRPGEDPNYLRLFDAMLEQPAYDEEALKAGFQGEAFVRQFHVTKNYLLQLLLQCLRQLAERKDPRAQVKAWLAEADLLRRRGMPELAFKRLRKAAKQAQRQEMLPAQLELFALARKMPFPATTRPLPPILGPDALAAVRNSLEQFGRYVDYVEKSQSWQQWRGEVLSIDPREHPLLAAQTSQDPLQVAILSHHLIYAAGVMKSDYALAKATLWELVEKMDQKPHLMKLNPEGLHTTLNNLLGLCLYDKSYEEIPPLLQRIHALGHESKILTPHHPLMRPQLQTLNLELEWYRDSLNVEAFEQRGPAIQRFIATHQAELPVSYYPLLHYQLAYLHFMRGAYSQSIPPLNAIFTYQAAEQIRTDIFRYARFLHLMLQFELGNMTVLAYALQSTRRYLKKKGGISYFEKRFLRYFSQLCRSPKAHFPKLHRSLYTDLFSPTEARVSADVLDYLDVKSWLEQKLPAGSF
ncbi:MAG: hypothetical protein AAFR61_00255 [Bacteroidota bacterium]